MLSHGTQFRNLIAMLLVLAIPFCCCNFRTLLGGSASCQVASRSGQEVTAVQLGATQALARSNHGCCERTSEKGSSEPTHDDEPADGPHKCTCDRAGGKMLSVEKPSLDLPSPVVVAILEWLPVPELRPLELVSTRTLLPLAVPRPLTSLVRLHCALVV